MSKPRYRWWGYVRAVVRAYPDLKRENEQLHEVSLSQALDVPHAGGGDAGSTVERIAMKTLPRQQQRELDAVEASIRRTRQQPDGKAKIRMIELVYWKQSHTLEGAAQKVHVSYRTARRWHRAFIMEVAKEMKFIE